MGEVARAMAKGDDGPSSSEGEQTAEPEGEQTAEPETLPEVPAAAEEAMEVPAAGEGDWFAGCSTCSVPGCEELCEGFLWAQDGAACCTLHLEWTAEVCEFRESL